MSIDEMANSLSMYVNRVHRNDSYLLIGRETTPYGQEISIIYKEFSSMNKMRIWLTIQCKKGG